MRLGLDRMNSRSPVFQGKREAPRGSWDCSGCGGSRPSLFFLETAISPTPKNAVTPPVIIAATTVACNTLEAAKAMTPAVSKARPGPFPLPPKAARAPRIMIGNDIVSSAAPRVTAANPVAPRPAPTIRHRPPATDGSLRAR